MKEYKLILVIFCLVVGFQKLSFSENKFLTKKMEFFFTKTLKTNYPSVSVKESYNAFLKDFIENKGDIKLKVDTVELQKINRKLSKNKNYSYYYSKLMITEDGVKWDSLVQKREKKKPKNLVIINNTNGQDFQKRLDVHLNKKGFYKCDLRSVNSLNSIKETGNYIAGWGALHLFPFSEIFLRNSDDLEYSEVQTLLAVVFWKYLCSQAGLSIIKIEKF